MRELGGRIQKDKRWLEYMRGIETNGDWRKHPSFGYDHGRRHALGVLEKGEKYLRDVGAGEEIVELFAVAALLHDIALHEGDKQGHAERGSEMAREFLREYEMRLEDVEIVCHAIKFHSDGEEMQTEVDVALLLGDKIGIEGSKRLAKGMLPQNLDWIGREFMKVTDIRFEIGDEIVRWECDAGEGFDVRSVLGWSKAVTVPKRVAEEWLGKEFELCVNGKKDPLDFLV